MTADPAGFTFSGGSSATLPLDGKGLVSSHSTTTSISPGTYVSSIEVYEPKSAGPEFSLDDVLNGTIDQNTTSINIKTASSPISYSGWEGGTLSAPFYIEVADSSSNKWYWKVTADVNNFDTSITVEFDEDDSHNATPSFNLGSDFGSAHSAGDIDFFASGSGGSPVAAVLTRATDFDADAEITANAFCFVEEGTTNGDAGFTLTTNEAITLDSTALTFTQFSGAGQLTAGDGIQKSGNTLSADLKANGGLVIESQEIAVDLSASSITGSLANGNLANSTVTLAQGAGMAAMGSVSLGGSVTVAVDGVLEDLDTLGAASADGEFIVATGSGAFAYESGATVRTSLGLGSAALEASSAFQAADAELSALAGLTSAANKGIQFTGSGTAGTYDLTAYGKSILDDADAAAARATLETGLAVGRKLDMDSSSSNANVTLSLATMKGLYMIDASGFSSATKTFTLPTTVGQSAFVGAQVTFIIKDLSLIHI